MEERRQERSVARVEPNLLSVQLPFQNADLVAQGQDLDIFSRLLIGSSRSIANAFVTPRYASLSSTTDHHAAPTAPRDNGDSSGLGQRPETRPHLHG
jgi:hypothetical protein